MGRDSNPRYLAVHTLSRRAQSTALAPIRSEPTSLVSIDRSCNPFVKLGRFDLGQSVYVDRIRGAALEKCGRSIWKGLLRDSRKELFAAAPSWCGTTLDSLNPSAWNLSASRASRLSGRQICHDSLAPTCVRATTRNATPLRRHFSLLTSGDSRSAITFSSVSISA
jgi:hypothetical protein